MTEELGQWWGQCHEIFYQFLFGSKDSTWAPYEQAKPVLQTFSSLKIACLQYIVNNCYWVCKHTQVLFLPSFSFKICEKPSKFLKSVLVVLSVSR